MCPGEARDTSQYLKGVGPELTFNIHDFGLIHNSCEYSNYCESSPTVEISHCPGPTISPARRLFAQHPAAAAPSATGSQGASDLR